MTIKLIAMDMDGTLLRSDNTISQNTKNILLEAQKKGIILALASGRSYAKLLPYAQQLQMQKYGGYLIEVNGMAVYDLAHAKRHVDGRMPKENAQEVFTYFSKWKVEIIGNMDEGMYDYNPPALLEEKKAYRKLHSLPNDFPWTGGAFEFMMDNRQGYPDLRYIHTKEEIIEDVNKISVTYWPYVMKEVAKRAKEDLKDRYWIGLTSDKWLEVMMPNVTKAYGLKKLEMLTGIKLDEMMAIGDGENDIEMLQMAGLGIAMGNAMENVKRIADDVTATNMQDRIVAAIHKHLGI